jgi:TubC N-terminal docking domain
MTQAQEIINTLSNLGVTIRAQGDNLVVMPRSKVPADLVEELRRHKAEIILLASQAPLDKAKAGKVPVGDGQLPPLDGPPVNETELRRLIDYLDDPVAFAQWFARLMQQTDPAEELAAPESSEYEGE